MDRFIVPSLINGLAVFVGLLILWSLVRFGTPKQRASYAALAALISALATFVISTFVSGAASS